MKLQWQILSVVIFSTFVMMPAVAQTPHRRAALNKPLQRELLRMEKDDQRYRQLIEDEMMSMSRAGTAIPSSRYPDIVRKQDEIDSRNMARLEEIIKGHGWPGKSLVGEEAAKAAFLILQHSDFARQQKYLPMLKVAAKSGEARPADAAMLEDRVLVRQGKPQLYGTQLHSGPDTGGKLVLSPIEDEEHVDERRSAVGLMPLAEYLKHFGLEYKPPASGH
ncbi:MAG: hypothetical protein QOJ64_1871 [Acidobacteriota bacterium]|jgi:hypothetical protein|nr:hypothetical protein [Acidobacteriota bacterium]